MPASSRVLSALEVVYERFPGWRSSTSGITSYVALPSRAKDYLRFLGQQTGVEIGSVSTGPEREQTILVPGSRLEKLLRSR
jgi:adenylosuccinate synthase